MGDATLPIDRFDVRGLLPDLSLHEAKNVETSLKFSDYLSPEDAMVLVFNQHHEANFCQLF